MCSAPHQGGEQFAPYNDSYALYSAHSSSSPRSLSVKTRSRHGAPAPLQVHASLSSPVSSMAYMTDSTLALASHSPRTFVPSDSSSNGPLSPASHHANSSQYIDTSSMAHLQLDQHHYPPSSGDENRSDMLPPTHLQRRNHQSFDASALSSHLESRRPSQVPPNRCDEVIQGPTWHLPVTLSAGYTSAPPSSRSYAASMGPEFDPNYRRATVASFHTPEVQSPDSAFYSSGVVTSAPLQRVDYANGAESISPLKAANAHAAVSPIPQREPSFQSNAAFRQHMHSVGTPGFASHRSSISNAFSPSSPVNASGARAFATPLLSRSTRSSESSWTSVPSTPTPAVTPASGSKTGIACPSMLTEALVSPRYDAGYTAPPMANNRSYSMASLGSAGESSVGSISMEGRGRSYSTSAVRNSTRIRPRNSDPPLIVSSADKQHACFCGQRFKRLEHLKRHSQVHTQERPFQCPIEACGRAFGRSDNLAQHLKTHARSAEQTPRPTEEIPATDLAAHPDTHLGGAIALNEPSASKSTLASFAGPYTGPLSHYQ